MRKTYDLGALEWQLTGCAPETWRRLCTMELGLPLEAELATVAAAVPGSVQAALRAAKLLPDWNVGLQARACEWVENRHWVFETALPDDWFSTAGEHRLCCAGLDYAGWIVVNQHLVGEFRGSHTPHNFVLDAALQESGNRLFVVFDCPPRWLGQVGHTSRFTDWKPRFNYTWDWTSRLVQIGIWDRLEVQVVDGPEIGHLHCRADYESGRRSGCLRLRAGGGAAAGGDFELLLHDGVRELASRRVSAAELQAGISWQPLPVAPWWPNGAGPQRLYELDCRLMCDGVEHDFRRLRVGFKTVRWEACEDAPAAADPWLCVVNGRRLFLQGVNWTPIRPNFADVSDHEYRQRLQLYRSLGCNVLRVWGGAFLEKRIFYDLCDELGMLVWQELPLSSSGIDNWPPEDADSIAALAEITASYITRRGHHVSLLMWGGGNELQGSLAGGKSGIGKPCDLSHPLLARMAAVVAELDPGRRFVPTSASGPRFMANPADFGKGLHWDVHGPWRPESAEYWQADDALFRSELGAAGASSVDILEWTAGDLPLLPASLDNPLWRRSSWWVQWDACLAELGREPRNLAEFVDWSQRSQAAALRLAVSHCKARFPRCGGVILWMGHDCFPCTANTAIVDYHGRPKPAALAVGEIFLADAVIE